MQAPLTTHHHHTTMSDLQAAAENVIQALRTLRSQCSDEQWDELSDGPLAELLDTCADLEHEFGDQE